MKVIKNLKKAWNFDWENEWQPCVKHIPKSLSSSIFPSKKNYQLLKIFYLIFLFYKLKNYKN